jgi:large subunit ribosomal protein L25
MPILQTKLRPERKANALRREGWIPAVVYGPTIETVSVMVDRRALQTLFSQITRSSRIDLSLDDDGKSKKIDVFVKRIQYNPTTDEPIHIDFYHPDAKRPLRLYVPVKVIGEAPGVKAGGMLDVLFNTIRVHGLPKDIPSLITIDVGELEMGEAIRVRDLDFGGAEPMVSPDRAIVTILAPHAIEEEVEEEELVEGEALSVGEETGEEEEGSDEEQAE